tara:strand:+ start:85 stop:825 length:741 start_codon:yes stop_codon:yes gene_type:complete
MYADGQRARPTWRFVVEINNPPKDLDMFQGRYAELIPNDDLNRVLIDERHDHSFYASMSTMSTADSASKKESDPPPDMRTVVVKMITGDTMTLPANAITPVDDPLLIDKYIANRNAFDIWLDLLDAYVQPILYQMEEKKQTEIDAATFFDIFDSFEELVLEESQKGRNITRLEAYETMERRLGPQSERKYFALSRYCDTSNGVNKEDADCEHIGKTLADMVLADEEQYHRRKEKTALMAAARSSSR